MAMQLELARFLSPSPKPRSFCFMFRSSTPGKLGVPEQSSSERHELMWRQFFSDPSEWWDNRGDKRSPTHPDFRHRTSRQPLWLNSPHKPAWVDSELATWDASGVGQDDEEASMLNTLRNLCGEVELSEAVSALDLLVQRGRRVPTDVFYNVLKRCMAEEDLGCGRRVHSLAVGCGYESNAFLATQIVGMYASHGELEDVMQVFSKVRTPDAHLWSSIMLAHARHGEPADAINLYRQWREESGKPNDHIFVAVLKACASAEDLVAGREIHADINASDVKAHIFVGNSLVNMYAKCGSLEEAREVFESMPRKDVVTWNAMIAGYSQQGLGRQALALYSSMQKEGLTPADTVTFVCLLRSCASVGALRQGEQLHSQIRRGGLEADVFIGSCLVDLYAKCGSLGHACSVFDRLPRKDVVTWNAMLNGYSEHGDVDLAIRCFEEMLEQGIQPNETTFLCLFVACSRAGLVHDGQRYFRMMVEEHWIVPTEHHYSCMVDLLGRSGRLDDAERMLQTPLLMKDAVGWKALLSACRSYGDVERGIRCFQHLVELEPESASPYVLLGNIYAKAGRWDDADRTESLRRAAGAITKPAKACIEVKNEVHEFTVGEERCDILSKLQSVDTRLEEEGGHVPDTKIVLRSVSEQETESSLCGHVENLALAYGLLNTPDGTTLLITKNLRMCNDCHTGTKIMSRLEKRDIIVRDAHGVHRFRKGSCSCGDRH